MTLLPLCKQSMHTHMLQSPQKILGFLSMQSRHTESLHSSQWIIGFLPMQSRQTHCTLL